MKNILLSLIGVASFATLSTPAQAHDSCHRSSYGYQRTYSRVYYVERPTYYRSSGYGYCAPQREYREVYYVPRYEESRHCEKQQRHHGLHGLLERLFR